MNTAGWSEDQMEGLKKIKSSLYYGLGAIALEGGLIAADVTDKISVPLLAHVYVGIFGAGLTASNLLYLNDIRRHPPQPLDPPVQGMQ